MLNMVILLAGVFCCSTAVIFIKAGNIDAALLAALRVLIAATILSPLFWRDWRHRRTSSLRVILRRSLVPGMLLSIHFISWIAASRMTAAANASLIVNLVPLALPVMLFLLLREKLTAREVIGTVLALSGMCLLTGADFQLDPNYFLGDILCFGSMLFFALYLAWARRHQGDEGPWLYVVPLYITSGLISLMLLPLLTWLNLADPIQPYTGQDWLMVAGLGIVPTVFGHSILNISMKRIRGQLVSIINMGQFVFAAIMAFVLLNETPPAAFLPASLLVATGAIIAINPRRRNRG